MTPPRSMDAKKVALFCTSHTPFDRTWYEPVCKEAEDGAIVSTKEGKVIKLVLIEGNFTGWTPLQLARRYVVPNLTREASPFASLAFVVADDQSHQDGQLLLAAIDWDFFDKPNSVVKIEATMRIEANLAVDLPIILHDDIHGIHNYPSEEYDNEAEPLDAL